MQVNKMRSESIEVFCLRKAMSQIVTQFNDSFLDLCNPRNTLQIKTREALSDSVKQTSQICAYLAKIDADIEHIQLNKEYRRELRKIIMHLIEMLSEYGRATAQAIKEEIAVEKNEWREPAKELKDEVKYVIASYLRSLSGDLSQFTEALRNMRYDEPPLYKIMLNRKTKWHFQ